MALPMVRMLARILPLFLGLSIVACSGASTPEIPLGTDTSKTEPAPPGAAAGGPSTEGQSSGAPSVPAGKNEVPPGDDPAPPPPATPTCAVEAEGNNVAEKATVFASCIAGVVSSSKDIDFLRIVAPPHAEVMLITHKETSGKVLYRVTEENALPILGPSATFTGEAPEIQVAPGAAYLFRVTFPTNTNGNQSADRPYEVTVTFK